MARAILDDFSDFLQIAALEVHRRRSKNSSEVTFGASSKLDESEGVGYRKQSRRW